MKGSIVKVAVAAAVILAVVGGLLLWSGTQSSVALANVLAKVEQVQAFMYQMTMHMTGTMQGSVPLDTEVEGTVLIAEQYGMRMEMNSTDPSLGQTINQQMYMLPEQKTLLMLMPALKKYMRMEFDHDLFEKKRQENNDPRLMLKKIMECQYTDLGRTVLDGIEVQGFQTTDPAYSNGLGDVDVKVWIDVRTELPVRVDMKMKMAEQIEMEGTLHDFAWNVPVSAAEFNPVIPEDYTAGPGDGIKVPPMNEETAITGLTLCRELTDKYPDDLNLMTLIQTATQSFAASNDPNISMLRQARDATGTPEQQQLKLRAQVQEQTKKLMDKMMPIQALGGFYMGLVQEQKEPAYYGKVVQPGDKALVLLRWKTGENEYRVLFGDLHAETVDADTLANLEAALPK